MEKCLMCVFALLLISVVVSGEINGCIKQIYYDVQYQFQTIALELSCNGRNSFDYEIDDDDYGSRTDCYTKFFSTEASSEVKSLNIGDCRGNRLNERFPGLFINLMSYDISNYGVEALTPEDLNFGYLKTFIARSNKLSDISNSIFVHAMNLEEIDFSHNEIHQLKQNCFKGATKLITVKLSNNSLRALYKSTFLELTELSILDMSYNLIQVIDKETFRNNYKLESLDLQQNPIYRIDGNILGPLLSRASVHVSWDNVTEFDSNSFNINIHAEYNSIVISNGIWFASLCKVINFQRFTYFNISGNHLLNGPEILSWLGSSLETLDASSNQIGDLSAQMFERFEKLKYLNLRNGSITTINPDTFHQNRKLKFLQLENNPILRIDGNVLWPEMNEIEVRVSFDSMEYLDTSCTENSLKIEFNSKNEIIFRVSEHNIELRCSKERLNNLKFLNVSGNQLQNTIELIEILGPQIETLDLSSNYIGQLNMHMFEGLDSLHTLNLSRTQLSNISFSTFHNQNELKGLNVQEIDFSFNAIENIPANAFNFSEIHFSFNDFRIMNFSHNNIQTVKCGTFANIDNLIIDLSNNLIKTIEKESFNNINHLQLLLQNNPIQRLDCHYFLNYARTHTTIMYVSWDNIKEFDASCRMYGNSPELQINMNVDNVAFQVREYNSRNNYNFKKQIGIAGDAQKILYFNISGVGIQNAEAIADLRSPIETIDVSFNSFGRDSLDASILRYRTDLQHLNLSHTQLSSIQFDTFSALVNLTTLDLSFNSLETIAENMFENNKKLEMLHLQNNPLKRINCNILTPLMNLATVDFDWDHVNEFDTSCLRDSLQVNLDEGNEIHFSVAKNNVTLSFSKGILQDLHYFGISGNRLHNTPDIIPYFGSSIETMDLSSNFVGKLNVHTFEKFDSLKNLNLSNTQLSNFGFSTFYHQRDLKRLDLSYNQLKKVNFTLLFRNFHYLETLNLEGNELTDINSINRSIFPALLTLGISKNHFSCDYLATFLPQWHRIVHLIVHPVNRTNIDGVDCRHDDQELNTIGTEYTTTIKTTTTKATKVTSMRTKTPPMIDVRSEPGKINSTESHRTTEKIEVTTTANIVTERASAVSDEPSTRFDCSHFLLKMKSKTVNVSCDNFQEIDTNCMENAVKIDIFNEKDEIVFHFHRDISQLRCSKENVQKLKYLNISGNQLQNTQQIIEMLGSSIQTLDVSSNFIGKLEAQTFENLTDLQYLCLSNTNLSNFGFSTFYHQNKLKMLDISYNRLKNIDFSLLLMNFKYLETLNLEGNDLNGIDSVSRITFPKLSLLGISKNNFSCEYLAQYSLRWEKIQFIHNPSKQTHIGGVDCQYKEQIGTTSGVSKNTDSSEIRRSNEVQKPNHSESNHILDELRALKYIFSAMFILVFVACCGYLVVKSKLIHRIKHRMGRNLSQADGMQDGHDSTHTNIMELVQHGYQHNSQIQNTN